MTGASDLLSSARLVGHLVWTESRLFEVTGRLVAVTPEPSARAFVATASSHHGWHAELLSTLLPVVAGGPTIAELVVPPPGPDILSEVESLSATVDRVRAVWQQVVPATVDAAVAHIASSSPLAEAATHRILRLVIADDQSDIAVAQDLLVGLLDVR